MQFSAGAESIRKRDRGNDGKLLMEKNKFHLVSQREEDIRCDINLKFH